jgi:hypothetical protein
MVHLKCATMRIVILLRYTRSESAESDTALGVATVRTQYYSRTSPI